MEKKEEREKKGKEVRLDLQKGLESSWIKPCLRRIPPLQHMHTHTRHWRGYVVGLSGLLTGFPPFITAGSLVLLLGGTAALGTVSPTSCKDGSLYMATVRGEKLRRENRESLHIENY